MVRCCEVDFVHGMNRKGEPVVVGITSKPNAMYLRTRYSDIKFNLYECGWLFLKLFNVVIVTEDFLRIETEVGFKPTVVVKFGDVIINDGVEEVRIDECFLVPFLVKVIQNPSMNFWNTVVKMYGFDDNMTKPEYVSNMLRLAKEYSAFEAYGRSVVPNGRMRITMSHAEVTGNACVTIEPSFGFAEGVPKTAVSTSTLTIHHEDEFIGDEKDRIGLYLGCNALHKLISNRNVPIASVVGLTFFGMNEALSFSMRKMKKDRFSLRWVSARKGNITRRILSFKELDLDLYQLSRTGQFKHLDINEMCLSLFS